jgi:hypothetical protein
MKTFDRYSLLCISVSAMILIAAFVNEEEPGKEDKDMVGVVYDIKTTQSGYSFSFEDAQGDKMRCFARTMPAEFETYAIKGSFSDDGSMFFISSMQTVPQNGLYHN